MPRIAFVLLAVVLLTPAAAAAQQQSGTAIGERSYSRAGACSNAQRAASNAGRRNCDRWEVGDCTNCHQDGDWHTCSARWNCTGGTDLLDSLALDPPPVAMSCTDLAKTLLRDAVKNADPLPLVSVQ